MKTADYRLTEGPVPRTILRFALPVFIGQLFQQLYNTADSLIVGKLVGTNALAAVTATGSVIYLIVGFFLGFSMGAGVVIARDIGAGDSGGTSRGVHTTVAMGLAATVFMTLLGFFFTPVILRWMETPDEVIEDAILYLRIYFGGSIGLIFYNLLVGILQASGDSTHPLYYLIFSSLLNVVLDVCFIRFLGMRVDGAALATAISQCVSAVLVLRRLLRAQGDIRIIPSKIRFDFHKLGQIVRIGLPTAVQACVIDLGNLMIQSYINTFGPVAMAGIGANVKLEGFIFLPVTAFSMAMSTFVAQNLGAGKKDRMRKGISFGLVTALGVVELLGALFFFLSPFLVSLFDPDPEVVRYGALRGQICGFFFCLCGFSHVSSAVMRGLGRATVPTVVMLTCWCAVRVLTILTVGRAVHDIRLVIWLYPVTWTLSSIVYVFYLLRLKKRGIF